LRREDVRLPWQAEVTEGYAHHALALAAVVGVGVVEEVHAQLPRLAHDRRDRALLLDGLPERRPGAEADRADLQTAPTDPPVLHLHRFPFIRPRHHAPHAQDANELL